MNQIIWSDLAYLSYEDISNYLILKFSLDTALRFDNEVEQLCEKLISFNKSCPPYLPRPQLRSCKVNKYISLIYRIDGKKIHLITFYDNRSIHHF